MVNRIFSFDRTQESALFTCCLKARISGKRLAGLVDNPHWKCGQLSGYRCYIGRPKAFRAVGNAIAVNPVGYLIPCHRVIAKSGRIHQYRWGTVRKKAILGWEASKSSAFRSAI